MTLQKRRCERLACMLGLKAKHLKTATMVGAYLGCLAQGLALAQPVITTQPANHFANTASSFNFIAVATGTPPLSYQWLFNGAPIAGATHNYLTMMSPQPAQWGYYSVIVSNASGAVTSQVAVLKVFTAAPHSLAGIHAQPDGSMNLTFAGETTATFGPYYDLYPLECSSNLVDWVPLVTLQRRNAAPDRLSFVDPNAPAFSQRFYRTPTNQLVTFLPQPTGPYAVGVASRLLTDTSRTNRRPFMVSIWYPTAASPGVWPNNYMDPRIAADYAQNMVASGSTVIYQGARAFAQTNSALSASATNFPILIYSHGQIGVRTENSAQAENLASQGYIVVGIDHNGAYASVYPNGTIIHNIDPATSSYTDPIYPSLILTKVQDIQFVLDELWAWNRSDPFFQGRLDLEHIGAFGWSLGGATVVQLCARDSRCKAAVALDGGGSTSMAPFKQALLYVYGGTGDDVSVFFQPYFLSLFQRLTNNACMFGINGAVHSDFCDMPLACDQTQSSYVPPVAAELRVTALLRIYLLSFFNKYLKGQDDHVLDGPLPDYPEIRNYLKK
jgi:predicted dienelactone hydrolase